MTVGTRDPRDRHRAFDEPPAPGADRSWREAGTRHSSRRLAGSIGASALLHVVVIVALSLRASRHGPPAPPVYRVDLVAAPPGARAIGTVAPEPPPATVAPTPEPAATPAPTPPRPETRPREMPAPAAAKPAPKPPPPDATPVPPAPTKAAAKPAKPTAKPPAKAPATPPKTPAKPDPTAPAGPRAGGGPEGGRGADVANVHIAGLDFPYSGYLTNIVRQVALRFTPPNRSSVLQADVSFLIHRDGSVSDVRVAKGSGSYAFDLEARGAVEAAGEARAFGPLPSGFNADVLPVTFSFDPRVIR